MLLWINMSGKPTTLLDWLSGKDVTMAKSVPAPGATVDGTAVENYLEGTEYFSENPRNLDRIKVCAAAGMDDTAGVSSHASAPSAGDVRLTAREGVNLEETKSIKDLVAIVREASNIRRYLTGIVLMLFPQCGGGNCCWNRWQIAARGRKCDRHRDNKSERGDHPEPRSR
jgi:hypothetical protein